MLCLAGDEMSSLAKSYEPAEQAPRSRLLITDAVEETIQRVLFCPCCGEAMICTPRLVCGECGHLLDLKCQVYGGGDAWYAECLTLDLLSKGDTEADAIRRLQIAMFSYVATVLQSGESTDGLIPRSAPFASWVRYYTQIAIWRLTALLGRRPPLLARSVPIGDQSEALRVSHCS